MGWGGLGWGGRRCAGRCGEIAGRCVHRRRPWRSWAQARVRVRVRVRVGVRVRVRVRLRVRVRVRVRVRDEYIVVAPGDHGLRLAGGVGEKGGQLPVRGHLP